MRSGGFARKDTHPRARRRHPAGTPGIPGSRSSPVLRILRRVARRVRAPCWRPVGRSSPSRAGPCTKRRCRRGRPLAAPRDLVQRDLDHDRLTEEAFRVRPRRDDRLATSDVPRAPLPQWRRFRALAASGSRTRGRLRGQAEQNGRGNPKAMTDEVHPSGYPEGVACALFGAVRNRNTAGKLRHD